jgi:hypothetical protein
MPRSLSGLFPSGFLSKIYYFSFPQCVLHAPPILRMLHDLIILMVFGKY